MDRPPAQLLMAVYVQEPWSAVRKVRLFDEDYRRIFNRSVTPQRLFLLDLLDDVVRANRNSLNNELKAAFASVRFTLNYLVSSVVRLSAAGRRLLETPEDFLPAREAEVRQALSELASEVVDTVNFYVSEKQKTDELFDAKLAWSFTNRLQSISLCAVSLPRSVRVSTLTRIGSGGKGSTFDRR